MNDHEFRAYIEKLFDAKLETVELELKAIIDAMQKAVVVRAELERVNTISKVALAVGFVGWAVTTLLWFLKH